MRGMPKLMATWAAITELNTDAQPFTDQAYALCTGLFRIWRMPSGKGIPIKKPMGSKKRMATT